MKWKQGRRSSNVEDRRGRGVPRGAKMGGGIGTVVIALVAIFVFKIDPQKALQLAGAGGNSGGGAGVPTRSHQPSAAENELADFVKVVLADTEDTWNALFKEGGAEYQEPVLVMFTDLVQSGCGKADAGMGPFYCPADHKVYIDLSFYDALRKRHKAPGDFAQAYVIAHEVGHHVQNLLGTSGKVHAMRSKVSKEEYKQLSVRLELQADFYAGVWAHHANRSRHILERGDIEEALTAASAIGDDRLQKEARGYVQPESFTHGTSGQRVRWFKKGLVSGQLSEGDTFAIPYSQL